VSLGHQAEINVSRIQKEDETAGIENLSGSNQGLKPDLNRVGIDRSVMQFEVIWYFDSFRFGDDVILVSIVSNNSDDADRGPKDLDNQCAQIHGKT
jgi:hypothetical protein